MSSKRSKPVRPPFWKTMYTCLRSVALGTSKDTLPLAPTDDPDAAGAGDPADGEAGVAPSEPTKHEDGPMLTIAESAGTAEPFGPVSLTEPTEPESVAGPSDVQSEPRPAGDESCEQGVESVDVVGFGEFERTGGTVLPPPNNLGHLSHVYQTVRPKLAQMMLDELTLEGTGVVHISRIQWEGCALKWAAHQTQDGMDSREVRAEIAVDVGGKDVNQDAAGLCEGLLLEEGRREPFAAIAVADGVTTSLYSEFGALLAVATALRSSVRFLEALLDAQGLPLQPPAADRLARQLCRTLPQCSAAMRVLRQEIVGTLTAYAAPESANSTPSGQGEARQHLRLLGKEGREHMSTTLIAVCATPRWFAATGFGNGIVWVGFSSGDCAATWNTDPLVPLDCHLSTKQTPQKPSYAWTAPLETSGIVVVGAGTDGIPSMGALRDAFQESGAEAVTKDVLVKVVRSQLEKYACDFVDNAALARIDVGISGGED